MSQPHYNQIQFTHSASTFHSILFLKIFSVALIIGLFFIFYFDNYLINITKYDKIILLLGLLSTLLLSQWSKLFNLLYAIFSKSVQHHQPILTNENGNTATYLPIPHLSNHPYWINKYIKNLPNNLKPKQGIFIFPLNLNLNNPNDTTPSDTEIRLFRLYQFYYTFNAPDRKMVFFTFTFFILVLLYFIAFFACFIILTYIFEYFHIATELYKIAIWITVILITYPYILYNYINFFHLPWIDNDTHTLQNIISNINLSQNILVYHYQHNHIAPADILPNDMLSKIYEEKENLMQTINAILQISIPLMFLAMISIIIFLITPITNT